MSKKLSDSISRREFLKTAGVGAAGLALTPMLATENAAAATTLDGHIILVAFAGGVRNKETILTPENVPNLMRIAEEGVVLPNTGMKGSGHFGSTYTIFTGCPEVEGIRSLNRSVNPTIFEYVRKHTGLPADQVWLSTVGGQQETKLAYGDHKDYGSQFGANVISGEGLFNKEFKEVMDKFGQPSLPSDGEYDAIGQIRQRISAASAGRTLEGGGTPNDLAKTAQIEKFILEEVAKDSAAVTGPAGGDTQAIRLAWQIMRIFKPKLLGIRLAQADVAHGSFNAYVDVIRRNDTEIGKLWNSVKSDQEMKDKTTVFILPEFGRDKDLNKQNGLDHGDGSEELRHTATIAAGPRIKVGKVFNHEVESTDMTPTICKLFGFDAPLTEGRVLHEILT